MEESILEVIEESIKGFYRSMIVDTATIWEFDKLCFPEIKAFSIKARKNRKRA